MNVALRRPMSRDEFLAWDGHGEGRWEFDGLRPVAMTGGTIRHDRLVRRLHRELERRLAGRSCEPFGPDAGIATVGNSVRYPDALVTCSEIASDLDRLIPDPVVVFEVISPTSGRVDRNIKLREYAAVPSIRHYVIVESEFIGVTVFTRSSGEKPFEAGGSPEDDAVKLPAVGIELSVAAIYRGVLALPGDAGT